VRIRTEAAEDSLAAPAPDYNQIRAMVQSRAAHDVGRGSTFETNFKIGSGLALQYSDALAGPLQEIPAELNITRMR
jgi:hypothetical protein